MILLLLARNPTLEPEPGGMSHLNLEGPGHLEGIFSMGNDSTPPSSDPNNKTRTKWYVPSRP